MSTGWGAIGRQADELHALADRVEAQLAALVERIERTHAADAPPASPGVTASISREVAAAAARLRHAAVGVQVVSAGLVERHGVHHLDAASTPRRWLARHAGLTHHQASALVRCSQARERFPRVGAAFLESRITAAHVDAVAGIIPTRFRGELLDRLVEVVRDIEPVLVEQAEELTPDEFALLCARVRDRLDYDGPGDRAAEPSQVWLTKTFNGRWSLKGDLSAVDGALLASMLADAIALLRDPTAESETPSDTESETPSDTESEAGPGSVADVLGAKAAAERPPVPPESELRGRALLDLVSRGAGAGRSGRMALYLHVDLDDLLAGDPTLEDLVRHNGNAHTAAGVDIDVDSLWGLLADADVTPVFNFEGTPLSYGRTRRLAPPVLKRILAHRDRHCRFPGCDVPANRCHAHHLRRWDGPQRGPTDPDNLAFLHTKHHRDHHARGWSIEGDPRHELEVRRPDGSRFTAEPAYRERMLRRREARRRQDADPEIA